MSSSVPSCLVLAQLRYRLLLHPFTYSHRSIIPSTICHLSTAPPTPSQHQPSAITYRKLSSLWKSWMSSSKRACAQWDGVAPTAKLIYNLRQDYLQRSVLLLSTWSAIYIDSVAVYCFITGAPVQLAFMDFYMTMASAALITALAAFNQVICYHSPLRIYRQVTDEEDEHGGDDESVASQLRRLQKNSVKLPNSGQGDDCDQYIVVLAHWSGLINRSIRVPFTSQRHVVENPWWMWRIYTSVRLESQLVQIKTSEFPKSRHFNEFAGQLPI